MFSVTRFWSSFAEGDENNCIGPLVKKLWNYAMHVLQKKLGLT